MDQFYDAVIIGGGPAGSTVATCLARAGRRVLVLEQDAFPRFHVGESLLPRSVAVLDEIGALPKMEAEFLRYLVRSEGRVVSRKSILEEVWGLHEDTDTRAIDNFVVRLRRYIEEDPSQPKHLQTVRGVGYRFVAEPE